LIYQIIIVFVDIDPDRGGVVAAVLSKKISNILIEASSVERALRSKMNGIVVISCYV